MASVSERAMQSTALSSQLLSARALAGPALPGLAAIGEVWVAPGETLPFCCLPPFYLQ